jgi:hypothetical protein
MTFISMDIPVNPRFDGYAYNPLVGPPTWFEVGMPPYVPAAAVPGTTILLRGFYLTFVEFRLIGQCYDGNIVDGDGCDSSRNVEPWSLCRSVAQPSNITFQSLCQTIGDFSAAETVLSTNFSALPLEVVLLDGTAVQTKVGQNVDLNTTNTITLLCPIADCSGSNIRSLFVRCLYRERATFPYLPFTF